VTRLRGATHGSPPAPPRTRFTRCAAAGSDLALPPTGTAEPLAIEVDEAQSRLEFEYVAVDPTRGHRLLYETRLEPEESAWSRPSPDTVLRYAGLAAGRYRLAVRARDPWCAIPGEPAFASLTVLPPPWRRPETLVAAALALVAAGWAVQRVRLRRSLALERVRTQIAADLHDDIGGGLARIAITSELARRGAHDERGLALAEIAGAARDLRAAMSDLVWALDARHGTLLDVLGRVRRAAVELVEDSGAALDVRAPDADVLASVTVPPDRKRHLHLFCKEALANVARHAQAACVEVELAIDERSLRLDVRDDGVGFDPDRVAEGHGLANLRRRARELGAALVVDSAPGRGTRVSLRVPATRAERDAARALARAGRGGAA
jgi:signal transduction histidine kinase